MRKWRGFPGMWHVHWIRTYRGLTRIFHSISFKFVVYELDLIVIVWFIWIVLTLEVHDWFCWFSWTFLVSYVYKCFVSSCVSIFSRIVLVSCWKFLWSHVTVSHILFTQSLFNQSLSCVRVCCLKVCWNVGGEHMHLHTIYQHISIYSCNITTFQMFWLSTKKRWGVTK